MNSIKFAAHGNVQAKFSQQNNILYINLIGPFNVEFVEKYEAVVGAERAKIDVPCWGSLVNVHGLALAPLAATNDGQSIVSKAVAKGLVATAVVLHEKEGLEMQKTFWSRIYASSDLPFRFFMTIDDATDWLTNEINLCSQKQSAMNSFKQCQ